MNFIKNTMNFLVLTFSTLSSNVAFQTDWLPGFGMSNTTDATCGAGSAYLSGAPEITPSFGGVRVVYSLVFYVVSCVLLFFCLSFSFLAMALS